MNIGFGAASDGAADADVPAELADRDWVMGGDQAMSGVCPKDLNKNER